MDERKLRPGQTFDNSVSIRSYDDLGGSLDHLGSSGKKVLADPAWTNVKLTQRLAAAGAQIIEDSEPCILAKAVKNETELQGARNGPDPRRRRRHPLPRLAGRLRSTAVTSSPSSTPPPPSKPNAERTRSIAAPASTPSPPQARTPPSPTTGSPKSPTAPSNAAASTSWTAAANTPTPPPTSRERSHRRAHRRDAPPFHLGS